jgi:2-polyprenyl-3-methyl-5-hydroxy-6-metoxy-1,4-benzoquinol methylase
MAMTAPRANRAGWSRAALSNLLNEEMRLILGRASAPGADKPQYTLEHLEWYLGASKDWARVILPELFAMPAGKLLDVGAHIGFIAGCAWRNGWKASAVDLYPIPNFSSLAIPEREIDFSVCNVAVDVLPFSTGEFDAVLLTEVLEHLMYPPALLFNEIRRVIRKGGRLFLTTPNPAALSKLVRLARGLNNEPHLDVFLNEKTFNYKGLTFFESHREARIWTVREITEVLAASGLHVVDYYYYGNTESDGAFLSRGQRVKASVNRWIRPLVKRNRLLGGGTFVIAEAR